MIPPTTTRLHPAPEPLRGTVGALLVVAFTYAAAGIFALLFAVAVEQLKANVAHRLSTVLANGAFEPHIQLIIK